MKDNTASIQSEELLQSKSGSPSSPKPGGGGGPQGKATRFKLNVKYLILAALTFLSLFSTVQCLIDDPVSQRSPILKYQPSLMYEHTFFDMSILDGTSLVQADKSATYFLATQSSRSQNKYQFVKANHTTQRSEIVYQKIFLPGYTVYGMCINDDKLDYLIGVEQDSGDIHVIRFKLTNDTDDSKLQMAIVKDFKVVDKDPDFRLSGDLYIHCKYDGSFKGVNTYSIGILGTYFHPNAISSYYYAKFSTKYNLTEYYIKSEDDQTMEVPRKVYMDTENRRVYLAIEINRNKYHDRTVYAPGAQPGVDNSNVAIICYSWTHGVREWITVVGSETYSDVFVDFEQYANYIYVGVNAVTPKYSSDSSYTDIFYYKIRSENGMLELSEIFGSPKDDKLLDIGVSFNGIYLYAMINGPFLPHRDNDKQWKTIGNATNLALIHIDFTDKILDITAYDFQNPLSADYINPYPTRFFLINSKDVQQNYILVTHRTNDFVDRKGGIYITYFNLTKADPFIQVKDCPGIGCSKCSIKRPAKCLECMTIYQLFQHSCYEGECPAFTYMAKDAKRVSQKHCKSCHYSCKTCNGPREDMCSSCCINGDCGPTYNRVPLLGKCLCPQDSAEVNGVCNFKCVMNLGARLNQKCLTQCPTNSYPMLKYDGASAQERTQFDPSQPNACEKYSYHLQFMKTSQGLPLPGPKDLKLMPEEFTIAFWVMTRELNAKSYFINLFQRGYVWGESASSRVYYKFMTGPAESNYITPVDPSNINNQKLGINLWTYITVSQRQTKTKQDLYYQIQVGIVQGNFGSVQDAGSTSGTILVSKYSFFQNTIYIGAQSDTSQDTSFSGYMKELQIYTSYRGLAQMQGSFSRTLRLYSYDDSSLIAYWKFTEQYTQDDPEYTINDFSFHMNQISYSKNSKPSYPQFILDAPNTINLCYMQDVINCMSLDYSGMPPVATSARSYIRLPTLDLKEYSRYTGGNLIRQQDDMLFYVPQNIDCNNRSEVLAKMNYTAAKAKWEVKDDKYNPMYLSEGFHYQQCYYMAKEEEVFNLAQVYVAYRPRTVDPSNGNIYNRSDNTIQFMTGFGDQAFGDVLRLARECDHPDGGETEFVRSNYPSYDRVGVTTSFNLSGTFYFCWFPIFTSDYLPYPIYESIHNLYWKIQYEPVLKSTFRTEGRVNQDMVTLKTEGTFLDGDLITFAWKGLQYADCNPQNFMGQTYMYNHSSWPGLWVGFETGIKGIKNQSMDDLQICWKPGAEYAPSVYIRVKKEDYTPYSMRIFGYDDIANQRSPELISFDPPYGSSIVLETNRVIKFNFKAQQVIPCKAPSGLLGQIRIYRGAVKKDGTYVKIETNPLWENRNLNEDRQPDPFQQGDLICTQTGQCNIILSQDTNRLKAGEVYFLTFYSYSFMTRFDGVKYYLFSSGFAEGAVAYDHFFMCRSFNIYPSDQLINGRIVTVQGVDLRQKLINAKYSAGKLESEIFYTKAINLRLKVYNTDQYQCTFDRPTATVAMEDVYDDHFIIRNLELRECNSGQLFADIEFLRGIRDDNADYSYLKAEKIYNIQIGSIGCHPSCKVCNGTLDINCVICTNSSHKLYMGKCYPECPAQSPEKDTYSITYHNKMMTQTICTSNCPFGKYSDVDTRNCIQCNQDCQTCNSSISASCITCNPIKYLFNGLCVSQCPSPHHENNFTDYLCHEISRPKFLQVKILSLGFLSRIPKDKTVYLKADINNTGGGDILSIQWQQMEPPITDYQIFSKDYDNSHDTTYQLVKLNNNVLMSIGFRQTVKVNVTVTNSIGDIAYDLYEFFMNDSPFTGDMGIAIANNLTVGTGFAAVDDVLRVNLTKWYDSSDDVVQMLRMKIHMIKSVKVGNTVQTQLITVTDLVGGTNYLYFRIPPISIDQKALMLKQDYGAQIPSDIGLVNVTYCVSAIDMFNAISKKCADILNVKNKMTFLMDYSEMVSYVQALDFKKNVTNLLFAANIILQTVQMPARPNTQPAICTLDIHCNNQGTCSSFTGVQKCECDLGYFGTYCDFSQKELPNLQNLADSILTTTIALVQSKPVTSFEIEIVANVVRALTNHPDIVSDDNISKLLLLLEVISGADYYAHQPYDQEITTMVFEAYSNTQLKIAHSYKLRRAQKDYLLLGIGMNLLFYQNAFTLKNDPTQIFIETNNNCYYTSDVNKTKSLVGGVLAPRKQRQYFPQNVTDLYTQLSRRFDKTFNDYCKRVMYKLQPSDPTFTYRGKAFEITLQHRVPSKTLNQTIFIKSKDAYWYFPVDMFDTQPGVASKWHEIKVKLMKHILHPFQFEPKPGAYLESNATSIEFYSLNSQRISVSLPPGSKNYIEFREPFMESRGIGFEWLRCMSWDPEKYQFINDNSCGFQYLYEKLPCSDCDQYNQVYAPISLCRCKGIQSQLAVVYYQVNSSLLASGFKNSIYTDFYAMKYWQESFGFIAVLSGFLVFVSGHVLISLLDGRLRRNLVIRLREKTRLFELQYGAAMQRQDGLFIKIDTVKNSKQQADGGSSMIASTKKVFKEGNEEQQKEDGQVQKFDAALGEEQTEQPKKKPIVMKKRRTTLPMKKRVFEDDEDASSSSEDEALVKAMKMGGDQVDNDDAIKKQMEEMRRAKEEKKLLEDQLDGLYGVTEEEEEKDLSGLSQKELEQYQRHQKVIKELKEQKYPHNLYNVLMLVRLDQVEGMTQTEFRKKVISFVRKLPQIYQDQVKEYLAEIRGQLNSTDEELFKSMKDVFKARKKERELSLYRLKSMVIHGSHLFSLMFVTSILSPRHIRWTLLFTNIVIIWFICAVFFNNTKDPLVVPDFNTQASSLAIDEMYIAFIAPIPSMILMWVVSCFLKMPNSQFINIVTLRQLEIAVIEYQQEQKMRFFMGYLVVMAIMFYIFYYLVQFSAMFGWKVSWVWYFTGIAAIFMQFAILDPLLAFLHWVVYRRTKKYGRRCQKCRSMSQGFNETYDISDNELKERHKKEQEEKQLKKQEKAELKKQKKGKKQKKESLKADDGGGLFGPTPDDPAVFPADQEGGGSDTIMKGKSSGNETVEDQLTGTKAQRE